MEFTLLFDRLQARKTNKETKKQRALSGKTQPRFPLYEKGCRFKVETNWRKGKVMFFDLFLVRHFIVLHISCPICGFFQELLVSRNIHLAVSTYLPTHLSTYLTLYWPAYLNQLFLFK